MNEPRIVTFLLEPEKKLSLRIEAAKRGITLSDLIRLVLDEKLSDASFFVDMPQQVTHNANTNDQSEVSEV